MRFEWDPEKDRRNLAKHGIGFDEALLVWGDALRLTLFDRVENGEERGIVVGLVGPTLSHPILDARVAIERNAIGVRRGSARSRCLTPGSRCGKRDQSWSPC